MNSFATRQLVFEADKLRARGRPAAAGGHSPNVGAPFLGRLRGERRAVSGREWPENGALSSAQLNLVPGAKDTPRISVA